MEKDSTWKTIYVEHTLSSNVTAVKHVTVNAVKDANSTVKTNAIVSVARYYNEQR